jgi:hypothetical protein
MGNRTTERPAATDTVGLAFARVARLHAMLAKTPVSEGGSEYIADALAAESRCTEKTQELLWEVPTVRRLLAAWVSGRTKRTVAAEVEACRDAEVAPLAALHEYVWRLERDRDFTERLAQWLWRGDSALDGVPAPLLAILRTIPRDIVFQAGPTSAVIEAELARRSGVRAPDRQD